jgi:integration host factor subunit alpha
LTETKIKTKQNQIVFQKEGNLIPMTLTKAQLIGDVHDRALGFSHLRAKSIETVEILLEIIKRTLESGEDVMISGFGKFCFKKKRKRRGRNPATGEDMMLAPRRVVIFKCSGKLRYKLNGKRR